MGKHYQMADGYGIEQVYHKAKNWPEKNYIHSFSNECHM
jgi:hypothetical protein